MYMSIEYIPCVIERAWATDLDKSFFV
jgi:hypothetical protein